MKRMAQRTAMSRFCPHEVRKGVHKSVVIHLCKLLYGLYIAHYRADTDKECT